MPSPHCCIALALALARASYPPRHDIRAALLANAMQSVVLAQVLAFLFRLSTCTPGTVYSTDGLGANEHRLLLVPIRETRTSRLRVRHGLLLLRSVPVARSGLLHA